MSKITFAVFVLPMLLFFGLPDAKSASSARQKTSTDMAENGALEKLIVENGSVTIELDLNRLNGISSVSARPSKASSRMLSELHFAVAANSFFSILVFNNRLRGPEQGSMALIPQHSAELPGVLRESFNQLVVEKVTSANRLALAVRDARTGFTFFNIEGHRYDYDAKAQLLNILGGRLLISEAFADALARPADAGVAVGQISITATMRPIEITQMVNGQPKSMVMPALNGAAVISTPTLVPGPDVIVGDLPDVVQFGTNGNFVGVGVGTTSCNNGTNPLDWYYLPSTNHPVIPQNFYRMSGGANNNDRFEQIGQSWLKHAFLAKEGDQCGFGCDTSNCVPGDQLCSGCSDTYSAVLNASQNNLGSRAWTNPFTGAFSSGSLDHTGHVHTGTSHRVTIAVSDLDPSQNADATYFAEAAYISPTEYTWCQEHPGECNMYNNVSHRQYAVSGDPPNFSFSPVGNTKQMRPAITAWVNGGATINQYEPDPGNDGIWFTAYKVTNPTPGVWHYEYALYNENLDRSIQSFSVPLVVGANISNIGFHAPPQEPGWANDGTASNRGYSSTPWTVTQASDSITWNTETIAQNPNANAIRFGTLYNFRFDADQPPQNASATVGFFKTGSPMMVAIWAPAGGTSPTPTLTPTPTSTATATATATATPTPRATPAPRQTPEPRSRPTPPPRP